VSAFALPAVRRRMLGAWAVALVLGVATFRLAGHCARVLPRPAPFEELAYYPSGRNVEPATIGHAETAADLAWLRAVQYYGEHRSTDNRFDRMFHVFDILTTLSPHFESAYVFGAFALAQEGHDFARAEQLMLKGIDSNPASGRLAFELGFLYYVKPGGRDLAGAAEFFEQAARLPDGPPMSRHFAAFSRQNSGDLLVAYQLWQQVQRSSDNRYLRDMAEREMGRIRGAIASGHREQAQDHLSTPRVLFKDER